MKHQPLLYLALGICLGGLLGIATVGYVHMDQLNLALAVTAAAMSMLGLAAGYMHVIYAHKQLKAAEQLYGRILDGTRQQPHDHE